jgi:hypothetical protein
VLWTEVKALQTPCRFFGQPLAIPPWNKQACFKPAEA